VQQTGWVAYLLAGHERLCFLDTRLAPLVAEKTLWGRAVRAVEAPAYVPPVLAEVRHSLKVGEGASLGCQFSADVPWNIRVWFG
jgi:hypothetical protein